MIFKSVFWSNRDLSVSTDLAANGWTRTLALRSTWWGHWVRSADRAQMHPSRCSSPGRRPCSHASERLPELGQVEELEAQSWLQTEGTVAPHSWTCQNMGWTPPDWAARDVVRKPSHPESAVVKETASETENRQETRQEINNSRLKLRLKTSCLGFIQFKGLRWG